jgi:hypothetical protein
MVEIGVHHSLHSNGDDRNDWSYAFNAPYAFMAGIVKSTFMESLGDTLPLFSNQ